MCHFVVLAVQEEGGDAEDETAPDWKTDEGKKRWRQDAVLGTEVLHKKKIRKYVAKVGVVT